MEFVIVTVIGGLVFALCFAVLLFKGRKDGQPAKLHMCGQGEECQCRKNSPPSNVIS